MVFINPCCELANLYNSVWFKYTAKLRSTRPNDDIKENQNKKERKKKKSTLNKNA